MRTPTAMIIGLVLAPCGLVLNLTSTVAPQWRSLWNVPGESAAVYINQGLWDICRKVDTDQSQQCGLPNSLYFAVQVVQVARGLMITSLLVTTLGIALASWGVRCWEDVPNFLISACSGIVIFISGVLSLIPVSWYYHNISNLLGSDSGTNSPTIYVGYCLVLGYLGSCLEIIGGFSLMLCFAPVCKKCMKHRKKTSSSMYYNKKQTSDKSHPSQVYTINQRDRYASDTGYSIHNDNYQPSVHNGYYQPDTASRGAPSVISHPRSYTNPMDVTSGEHPRSYHRPGSQQSSQPCDSDLL